jgi:hypothetical protein
MIENLDLVSDYIGETFRNWYKSGVNKYLKDSMKRILEDTEIRYAEDYTVKSVKDPSNLKRTYYPCYKGEPFGEPVTVVDLDFPLRNADILDKLGAIIAKHKDENEALKNLMK